LDKAKQDFLLPLLENGNIIMIGATTENPFFSVTPAIRSRVQIFELEPLSNEDIKEAILGVLEDKERGFDFDVQLDEDALDFIATATNGDLRSAYNSLDLAVMSTLASEDGLRHITLDTVENSLQRSYITMDKVMYFLLCKNLFEALMLMPVFTMQHVWLKQEISLV